MKVQELQDLKNIVLYNMERVEKQPITATKFEKRIQTAEKAAYIRALQDVIKSIDLLQNKL